MTRRLRSRSRALTFGAVLLALGGCEDPVVAGPVQGAPPGSPAPVAPAPAGQPEQGAAGDPAAAATDAAPAGPVMPQFEDDDFVELDIQNRDPFRSYAASFVVRVDETRVQRRVLLGNVAIDELRLIAIVTGLSQPRAMVLDRSNVGWVIKRGDYVGRAEVVQTGGAEGVPVTLNWRVDRIRENEVVLTRDDPTAPNRPPLTRVIPLRQGEVPNPLLEQLDSQGEARTN
jgi:type IV pilus assembly protein PilP